MSFDDVYASAPPEGAFGPVEAPIHQCLDYVEDGLPAGHRTALDIGCGDGRHASFLADRGWTIVGLDASATGLVRASERVGPRFHGHVTEFSATNVRDSQHVVDSLEEPPDLVLSITYLDHLAEADRSSAFDFIRYATPDDAYLLLSVFSEADPGSSNETIFARRQRLEPSPTIPAVRHYFTMQELLGEFATSRPTIYAAETYELALHPPRHFHGLLYLLLGPKS